MEWTYGNSFQRGGDSISDVSIENPASMCIEKTRDIQEFKSDIESFQRTPKIEEYNYQFFHSKHPMSMLYVVQLQMW